MRYIKWNWHHRVRLFEPVRITYYSTLKCQAQNLTSGQVRSRSGHDQVGQYAYLPKRLDELSRLASFALLYLRPVASCWRQTDCDVMCSQLTFPWPPIISCTLIIRNGVSSHVPEIIGWFRLAYAKREAFWYFLIDLKSVTKFTWPWATRIKNSGTHIL